MNELLLRGIETARRTTLSLVDDISDEDLVKVPKPLELHPAYILGHLDLFDSYVLMSVNEQPPKFDVASGINLYGPTGSALLRRDVCQQKSWYVQRLHDRIQSYQNVLRSLNPSAFARDNPFEELRVEFPKVADLFSYVPCHENQHADDLVRWRELVGYPLKESRRFKR